MRRRRRDQGDPAPIQDVLPGILRGIKPEGPVERVRKAWVEAVGGEIANRTRVAGFANGRVTVEVASAALKHDLATFRAADLLKALRERLPDAGVQAVSYRVASLR